ncbi:hypothetical protein [Streptomyces sp. NPDC056549]|uniref:hypothetical protein n=1 Tax=Streptomyces sp. NPDC056549 TaxID=3345864 RepID=UPI0036B5D2D7
MGAGPIVVVLAVVWLLVALIPLRSPSARKGLGAFVLSVSVLAVIGAGVLADQDEKSPDYTGTSPAVLAMFAVGLMVAPAAIAAIVRLARASGTH